MSEQDYALKPARGFVLFSLIPYLATGAFALAVLAGAAFWHNQKVKTLIYKTETRLALTQKEALVSALLLQQKEQDANSLLLKNHISRLAASRNSSLLDAQTTTKAVNSSNTGLNSLLGAYAKSNPYTSCPSFANLPEPTASGSSPSPSAAAPGEFFPECAKSLQEMAKDADALTSQIRSLQAYSQSLIPFFESKP